MAPHKIILLSALVAFCSFSLWAKENYPFSHYPMYGDPDPAVFYHYLANAEGKPIATYPFTGKSAAQVGKIIRSRSIQHAKKLGIDAKKMTKDDWDSVCRDTLAYLHEQSKTNGTPLPDRISIMRTDVRFDGERVDETTRVLFAE